MNLKPNWKLRICEFEAVLKILPASATLQSTQSLGWPRLTWLNMLKPSARNSRFEPSVTLNLLNKAILLCQNPGPRNLLLPTFPNCPAGALDQGPPVIAPVAGLTVAGINH